MVYSNLEARSGAEEDSHPNSQTCITPNSHKLIYDFAKRFTHEFISLEAAIQDSWQLVVMGLPYVRSEYIVEYVSALAQQIRATAGRRSMKYDFGVDEVVQALKVGITLKDISLEGKPCIIGPHNRNVEFYAGSICRGIGLPRDASHRITTAAGLHDIGKVVVPNHILEKRGRLTKNEMDVVKVHPLTGKRILQRIGEIFGVDTRHIDTGIVTHQEKFGGGGYPGNLAKEAIPIDGQIIAIADSFDAMTSCRPYHKRKTMEEALEELRRDPRNQFNSRIVDEALAPLEEAYAVVNPESN
ncbi:HD domain-containing protein [Candidatus Woesearchaeota archaeon]|nr:HD domain-containing protein [Candidatus Woesearchaeota archaeon]